MRNYTGYGWEGSNYDSDLGIAEISKIVKSQLKKIPDTKWSVRSKRFSGGRSLDVYLLEAPFEVFTDDREYENVNYAWIDRQDELTDEAKSLMKKVCKFVNSFNYDDSDSQIDYFNTNFYAHYSIGKWDRPFKKVEPTEENIWEVS